jgi:hypothetical protein
MSHNSEVVLELSKTSYKVNLILASNLDNQCSTAPSQKKSSVGNGTTSSSLEVIALAYLATSPGFFGGKKTKLFMPSKQSPTNSQTLGGFVPFDKMVNND